jgi:catechol 2,3-dioxygenase-like lactoylglutathione lyase family enzyme
MSIDSRAEIRLASVVPQFTVPDVVRTAEYYHDTLGFHVAPFWGTPPVFAVVWRDQVELFFNQATVPRPRTGRAPGAYDVYVRVSGVEALAAELRARGADIIEGPELRVYDQLELIVRDCNGLVLAFGEAAAPRAATCE